MLRTETLLVVSISQAIIAYILKRLFEIEIQNKTYTATCHDEFLGKLHSHKPNYREMAMDTVLSSFLWGQGRQWTLEKDRRKGLSPEEVAPYPLFSFVNVFSHADCLRQLRWRRFLLFSSALGMKPFFS